MGFTTQVIYHCDCPKHRGMNNFKEQGTGWFNHHLATPYSKHYFHTEQWCPKCTATYTSYRTEMETSDEEANDPTP